MSQVACTRTIPFGRPWISAEDREAVLKVLEGHILTHGPECAQFEEEFAGFMGAEAHCVSVSSGMAALHLAYLHFGIGSGDEVIVPAMTHVATAHAVEWVGATPVFVDCDRGTGNLTADRIAQAITPRTRAISVVHFQGIPCDMPEIMALAEKNNLKVIEDCALAVGGRLEGKHVGLFGDAACFSFYPVKHLTSGEGGMFATRHQHVATAVSRLRAFGVDRRHDERKVPGMYDVVELGLNYRMSELQAALGRSQLRRIQEILSMRGNNFSQLKQGLMGIEGIEVLDSMSPSAANAHYGLTMLLPAATRDVRDAFIFRLKELGVGTSVYYPQPVPRMKYYAGRYEYDATCFPNAVAIADNSIALPVGPHVTRDDIETIIHHVRTIYRELEL